MQMGRILWVCGRMSCIDASVPNSNARAFSTRPRCIRSHNPVASQQLHTVQGLRRLCHFAGVYVGLANGRRQTNRSRLLDAISPIELGANIGEGSSDGLGPAYQKRGQFLSVIGVDSRGN
jgi:hypothetical protein